MEDNLILSRPIKTAEKPCKETKEQYSKVSNTMEEAKEQIHPQISSQRAIDLLNSLMYSLLGAIDLLNSLLCSFLAVIFYTSIPLGLTRGICFHLARKNVSKCRKYSMQCPVINCLVQILDQYASTTGIPNLRLSLNLVSSMTSPFVVNVPTAFASTTSPVVVNVTTALASTTSPTVVRAFTILASMTSLIVVKTLSQFHLQRKQHLLDHLPQQHKTKPIHQQPSFDLVHQYNPEIPFLHSKLLYIQLHQQGETKLIHPQNSVDSVPVHHLGTSFAVHPKLLLTCWHQQCKRKRIYQ
nr:hypothetical protein Iba_chr07bCG11760 [Ipomoea batatas]